MREEFGFKRTNCDCIECQAHCRYMPGFLVPADLDRMIPKNVDPCEWAKRHLLASPGALLMQNGETFRVPTLVPAVNKESGHCIHFADGRCQIYEIAPFGCAFFDCSQSKVQGDTIARPGIIALIEAWRSDSLYAKVWRFLERHGKCQKSAEVLRQRMAQGKQIDQQKVTYGEGQSRGMDPA